MIEYIYKKGLSYVYSDIFVKYLKLNNIVELPKAPWLTNLW